MAADHRDPPDPQDRSNDSVALTPLKLFDDNRSAEERAQAIARFRRTSRWIGWLLLGFSAMTGLVALTDGEWTDGRSVVAGVCLGAGVLILARTWAPWRSETPGVTASRSFRVGLGSAILALGVAVPALAVSYEDFFDRRYAWLGLVMSPLMIAIGVGALRRAFRG